MEVEEALCEEFLVVVTASCLECTNVYTHTHTHTHSHTHLPRPNYLPAVAMAGGRRIVFL